MNTFFNRFILPLILLAGGAVFAFLSVKGFIALANYKSTEAEIARVEIDDTDTDSSRSYTVYVKYTVDGKEYTGQYGEKPPSYAIGTKLEILYNPENPADIDTPGIFGKVICAAFAVLMFILGGISLVQGIKKKC